MRVKDKTLTILKIAAVLVAIVAQSFAISSRIEKNSKDYVDARISGIQIGIDGISTQVKSIDEKLNILIEQR